MSSFKLDNQSRYLKLLKRAEPSSDVTTPKRGEATSDAGLNRVIEEIWRAQRVLARTPPLELLTDDEHPDAPEAVAGHDTESRVVDAKRVDDPAYDPGRDTEFLTSVHKALSDVAQDEDPNRFIELVQKVFGPVAEETLEALRDDFSRRTLG